MIRERARGRKAGALHANILDHRTVGPAQSSLSLFAAWSVRRAYDDSVGTQHYIDDLVGTRNGLLMSTSAGHSWAAISFSWETWNGSLYPSSMRSGYYTYIVVYFQSRPFETIVSNVRSSM